MTPFFAGGRGMNSQGSEGNTLEIITNVLIYSSFDSPRHSGFSVGNNNLHTKITSSRWWRRNESERETTLSTSYRLEKNKPDPFFKDIRLVPFHSENDRAVPTQTQVSPRRWIASLLVALRCFADILGRSSEEPRSHKRKLLLLKHRGVP